MWARLSLGKERKDLAAMPRQEWSEVFDWRGSSEIRTTPASTASLPSLLDQEKESQTMNFFMSP